MADCSTSHCNFDAPRASAHSRRAGARSNLQEAPDASPSPLNGKKAGMRGEAVRLALESSTRK
jgi:hypothetical protein